MTIHPLTSPRSIDRAIADLIDAMEQYDPSHPRAIRLAAMIDGLQKFKGERAGDGLAELQAA